MGEVNEKGAIFFTAEAQRAQRESQNFGFSATLRLKHNSQRNRQLQLPTQSHLNNLLKRGESHFLDVVFDF